VKQRSELEKAFAPLKGHSISMAAQSADPEARGFAGEIEATLKAAGVNTIDSEYGGWSRTPVGIELYVANGGPVGPDTLSDVKVVQQALMDEGFRSPFIPPPVQLPSGASMRIFVGSKPE
jgi:hypothetical protein